MLSGMVIGLPFSVSTGALVPAVSLGAVAGLALGFAGAGLADTGVFDAALPLAGDLAVAAGLVPAFGGPVAALATLGLVR